MQRSSIDPCEEEEKPFVTPGCEVAWIIVFTHFSNHNILRDETRWLRRHNEHYFCRTRLNRTRAAWRSAMFTDCFFRSKSKQRVIPLSDDCILRRSPFLFSKVASFSWAVSGLVQTRESCLNDSRERPEWIKCIALGANVLGTYLCSLVLSF